MRMTVHRNDPSGAIHTVSSELEKLFVNALKQCVRDGASLNDLVNIYLDCAGLEYRFQFNPSGPHAVTIGMCISFSFIYVYFLNNICELNKYQALLLVITGSIKYWICLLNSFRAGKMCTLTETPNYRFTYSHHLQLLGQDVVDCFSLLICLHS